MVYQIHVPGGSPSSRDGIIFWKNWSFNTWFHQCSMIAWWCVRYRWTPDSVQVLLTCDPQTGPEHAWPAPDAPAPDLRVLLPPNTTMLALAGAGCGVEPNRVRAQLGQSLEKEAISLWRFRYRRWLWGRRSKINQSIKLVESGLILNEGNFQEEKCL